MGIAIMAIIPFIGHLFCVISLITGAWCIRLTDWMVRTYVSFVQLLTGAEIEKDRRKWHPQREIMSNLIYDPRDTPEIGILDEKETLKNSSFPLDPEKVISLTKNLLSPEAEFGSKKPELLAEDFQFIFPVVGPLTKTEFCTIFSSFKVKDAFPDSCNNFFGFTVDPMEPNRVWYFSRAKMTHSGTLKFGSQEFPPTGKEVVCSP